VLPENIQEINNTNIMEKPAGPCVIVIFGASGDLTMRKLIPALYNLSAEKLLPDEFAVIGFARKKLTNKQFREQLSGDLCQFVSCELNSPELQDWISQRLYYVQEIMMIFEL
jgi:Glucose-6-phosphate 1-dehydrogenase